MNRMEEWEALHRELEKTPPELAFTMTRVKARNQRKRTLKFLGIPAASLGGMFAAFVLMVNFSLSFSLACVSSPFLKELMAAVAVTPSLKRMVEHDFVQPMELTAEKDGGRMTIHYLAYDGSEVNLFYTATYQGSDRVEVMPGYFHTDGTEMKDIAFSSGMPPEKGELGRLNLHFYNQETPQDLKMRVGLYLREEEGAEQRAEPIPAPDQESWRDPNRGHWEESQVVLDFDLHFDERFTEAERSWTPKKEIFLDGQTLVLEKVTTYPTGTMLEFSDKEENTAWLRGLELWMEDGKGNRYGKRNNSVFSSGGEGKAILTYWLESTYFQEGPMTLCISEAQWLEKGKETAYLDLAHPARSRIPGGTILEQVERKGEDVKLTFRTRGGENIFSGHYTAPDGTEYWVDTWGILLPEEEGAREYTYLWNYPWKEAEMDLNFTSQTWWEEPIRIPVQ